MMNMSGTGGYILHAFKMYVISSALMNLQFHPDISPFTDSTIQTHKQYSYTAKRSVRSRNRLKPKGGQSHQARTL